MKNKTVIRIAKSGRKYYYSPKKIKNPAELTDRYYKEDEEVKVYIFDKNNPHYLKYVEKKIALKRQYPRPKWITREELLDYYKRVLELIYTDEDYKRYKEETKTMTELEDDRWWEEKKQKEKEYNGRNDEYEYFG